MKLYAIKNDINPNRIIAYLIYYERSKTFYIEIEDDVDEWDAPLLLSTLVRKGERTVDSYWSKRWVSARIVPPDRQNIGMILRDNKLKEYDEYELLRLGCGRCAQDDFFIEELSSNFIPNVITKRMQYKIQEVVPLSDYRLLVFFMNGVAMKCGMKDYLVGRREFSPVISQESVFERVQLSSGNYGIQWGEQLKLLGKVLYDIGTPVDVAMDDFVCFIKSRVVNAAETAMVLECSRQNVNALVKREQLIPVKSSDKETLFLKKDVQERLW